MYDFRNLDIVKNDDDPFIPAEAMYFRDTELPIESIIPDYVTLTVSGREIATPETKIGEYSLYDGGTFINRRFPSRQITVTYALLAHNDNEFREAFNLLNEQLFNRKEFQFYFKDDPNYYWTGSVTAVEEFPAGQYQGKSSFTITCTDPYKHSKDPFLISGIKEFKITEDIVYPSSPDKITWKYTGDVQNTYIQDGNGHEIMLDGIFAAGDELELIPDDPKGQFVYLFGEPTPWRLKLGVGIADIHTFYVKKGSNIVVNANCEVVLEVSKKLL